MGRSNDRARRTVFPSLATRAKDPSIFLTASAEPRSTRDLASSVVMFIMRLAEGSVRSTTRSRYWFVMVVIVAVDKLNRKGVANQ